MESYVVTHFLLELKSETYRGKRVIDARYLIGNTYLIWLWKHSTPAAGLVQSKHNINETFILRHG